MAALTLARDFRWEQVIEKSRFICSLKKVRNEGEAQDFIKAVKKEYWDASHNCSAYLIDELAQRSSDDGEPSGTAGVPMLEVLRKQNLCQVAAVVTRYFGGIKLGAGGLIRAYGGTVAQALSQAGLAERVLIGCYTFTCGVSESGKILNLLYQQQLFTVADVAYGALTTISLRMPELVLPQAEAWLTDALQQKVELTLAGSEYEEVPVR